MTRRPLFSLLALTPLLLLGCPTEAPQPSPPSSQAPTSTTPDDAPAQPGEAPTHPDEAPDEGPPPSEAPATSNLPGGPLIPVQRPPRRPAPDLAPEFVLLEATYGGQTALEHELRVTADGQAVLRALGHSGEQRHSLTAEERSELERLLAELGEEGYSQREGNYAHAQTDAFVFRGQGQGTGFDQARALARRVVERLKTAGR